MWELINGGHGFVSSAFGIVAQHPEWALVAAFLAAIIEAVAVVGTFLPGTVVVMGIAGAAAAARQPMLPFLAVAALGAMLGDYFSYWIGYRYRFVVRQWWPLGQRPQLMAAADRFFARYGTYSVALCRFSPVLRSLVPLVAGIAGMSRGRFLIANVTSALLWAAVHIWPAQIAGLSIDRLRDGNWQMALLLGAGVPVICVALWAAHRRLARLMTSTPDAAQRPSRA
jgi:membrane protein DedA with SNARE-associated domain